MHLKNLNFQIIDHVSQRYPSVGDYWIENDILQVRVSAMSDWRYAWLVFVHEIVEFLLITLAGIPIEAIDTFDKEYEYSRKEMGLCEPGDCKDAPYYMQHQIATGIERILAPLMGVDWNDYSNDVDSL